MISYRVLYFLLKHLLHLLRPLLGASFNHWLELRRAEIKKEHTFSGAVWFHASSGEIEYCKSVIRLYKEKYPEAQIVVTYSSPSAAKLFHNISGLVTQFIPLPWDQPQALNELLDYINPKILVFSRTDFWPELIHQVHTRNIPMGVVSFHPKFGFVNNILYKKLLSKFDFISCLSEIEKDLLAEILPAQAISADGDTRFDQVFHRLNLASKIEISKSSKIFVAGSTWPEDESVLFQCFRSMKTSGYKIILSPHEVAEENITRLKRELDQAGLSARLLSTELIESGPSLKLESDVMLIDKIGFLADSYRFADLAFVGGSFKEKIHSVMEPLCCGVQVLTGPYYKNNPEAVKYHGRYVHSFKSSDEILDFIEQNKTADKAELLSAMQKNKNASEKVLKIIQDRLLKN